MKATCSPAAFVQAATASDHTDSPVGCQKRSAAALPPAVGVKLRTPPETESAPETPAGRSAVNFASSPAAAPERIGIGTPFTKVNPVMSTATVPSAGRLSEPPETSKYAFCAGLRSVPAPSVSG